MYRISDEHYLGLRQWVHNYIDTKCIVRDTVMPAKRKGYAYTWMFYLRRGLFDPMFLINVSQMFIYKMERIDPNLDFQISGLETAATPLIVGLSMVSKVMNKDINAFIVRKERKEYGLLNMFEGTPNDKIVVMMDDLCNSSNSLSICLQRLIDEGLMVADVAFTIVNKSNKEVHTEKRLNTDMYLPDSVQVISLFTLDDFNLTDPSH
jgi:orotate phosphoribosyltransferase